MCEAAVDVTLGGIERWDQVRLRVRLVMVTLAISGAVGLTACTQGNTNKAGGSDEVEPVVLTFASNSGVGPELAVYLEQVDRLAEGTLRIDIIADWRKGEPGQEVGLIEDVQAGNVDMAWVGARAFDGVGVRSFEALVSPFLVDSYALQDAVFDAGIPRRMLQGLAGIGITGIGVLPGPMRKVMGVSHPFVAPADFDGAVVGTSGGRLAEQTLRVLGATPMRVPARASLDGLDGLDYQVSAIYGNEYFEGGGFVSANVNLWPRPLVLVMNADRFAALSDEQRAILREAATAAIEPASVATRREERDAASGLCATGMTVVAAIDSDRDALARAVEPILDELEVDPETKAFLDEITAMKTRLHAPPESFDCPGGTAVSGASITPLDGVYRASTTVDDLRRAGDPNPVPENWGDWIYVLDRGRFAFTQENDEACGWGYGTFILDDDRLEFSFLGGGGIAPNNAVNKPGEFFVFGWSLYRDVLTFTAVPGEISPDNFMLKPWRRTGEAPSAGVFPSRCPPPPDALWPETGEPIPTTTG